MDPSTCPGGASACLGSEPGIFAGEAAIGVPGKWTTGATAIRVSYVAALVSYEYVARQFRVWKICLHKYFARIVVRSSFFLHVVFALSSLARVREEPTLP